jgi:hypothetical protein
MPPITVYALRCTEDKWYVGRTERSLQSRVVEHFIRNGSEWTKKYPPIEVDQVWENCDMFDEDKYTKMYMARYGIQNVRGGAYVQISLHPGLVESLTLELRNVQNTCFKCGSSNHFVAQCRGPEESVIIKPASAGEPVFANSELKEISLGMHIDEDYSQPGETIEPESMASVVSEQSSLSSLRTFGNLLTEQISDENSITRRLAAGVGFALLNFARTQVEGRIGCIRCGRTSHTSGECYARTHISGRKL